MGQRRPIRHCEEPLRRSNPEATTCAAPATQTVVLRPLDCFASRNDGQGIGSLVSACRLSLRKAGRGSLRGETGAPAGDISPRGRRRFFTSLLFLKNNIRGSMFFSLSGASSGGRVLSSQQEGQEFRNLRIAVLIPCIRLKLHDILCKREKTARVLWKLHNSQAAQQISCQSRVVVLHLFLRLRLGDCRADRRSFEPRRFGRGDRGARS